MNDDELDPRLAERFDALMTLPAPDTWGRVGAPLAFSSGRRWPRPVVWAAAAVVVAAIGVAAGVWLASDSDDRSTVATGDSTGPFACPVTAPPDPAFVPPDPWPASPTSAEFAWYGSDALWTVVDATGGDVQNKSVWWSAKFPGGGEEEAPEIAVVYDRLDVEADPIVFPSPGTNASTATDGHFMINGVEPDDPGCWRGTATYKGATLSYVFEN